MRMTSCHGENGHDQFAEIATYQGSTSLRILSMGFLELAGVGVRASTAIDATTPAIMYAIRHAVELFVKHIWHDLHEMHPELFATTKPIASHKLQGLWCSVEPNLKCVLDYEAEHDEHNNFDRHGWIDQMQQIIREVNAIDPNGQMLRYSTANDGTPHYNGKLVVNVSQLERFAEHVTDCFWRYTLRSD